MDIAYDVIDFVKEYKWWLAPIVPFIIGFIVVKLLG